MDTLLDDSEEKAPVVADDIKVEDVDEEAVVKEIRKEE